MKRVKYDITCQDGIYAWHGYETSNPYLAVGRAFKATAWAITHLPTGLRIAIVPTVRHAQAIVNEVAHLDWSQDQDFYNSKAAEGYQQAVLEAIDYTREQ